MMQPGVGGESFGNAGIPALPMEGSPSWMMDYAAPPVGPTPGEIVKKVEQHWQDTLYLRERMEGDYKRYRLDPHVNTDVVTKEPLEDYAVYTSSEPKSFGNKIISWLSKADMMVRVEHMGGSEHSPEVDSLKERLAIGLFKAADERLVRMLEPGFQGATAFYVAIRGGYVGGRAMLAKKATGETYVDIRPWDPLHTHWGMGADGLSWACYKVRKTRQQIENEYGITVGGGEPDRLASGTTDPELTGIDVYDYYDGQINTVVTAQEVLKPPTLHGSPRVPCYLVLVGNVPVTQAIGITGTIADVGESIYESLRDVYEKFNDMMSVMLELTARARRQGLKIVSRDGKKTLPEDPYKEGTEISLAEGEDVKPLGLLEMAHETGVFMGQLSSEIQRGSLPHSAYGELQFQLSGFAINSLRQGIETVLSTRLEAMEQIDLQVANLLYDQYRSGNFDAMRLSGVAEGRKRFSQKISPEIFVDSCDYEVTLTSELPQDDMTKWTMAQMATQGPVPLVSKEWARDEILHIQDSELAGDMVDLEQAENLLPAAKVYSLMQAAEEQGRPDLAKFYFQELLQLIAQQMGLMPPQVGGMSPMGPGRPPMGPGGGPGNGVAPQVRPHAANGGPPPPGNSNTGPSMIAPGTPRPGTPDLPTGGR